MKEPWLNNVSTHRGRSVRLAAHSAACLGTAHTRPTANEGTPLRASWPTEAMDWCLLMIDRLNEGDE
jgi:hypothetical protein